MDLVDKNTIVIAPRRIYFFSPARLPKYSLGALHILISIAIEVERAMHAIKIIMNFERSIFLFEETPLITYEIPRIIPIIA
ncbi:MAG: hypothetical protein AAF990_10245, partial [Bacteroidota bacterium]